MKVHQLIKLKKEYYLEFETKYIYKEYNVHPAIMLMFKGTSEIFDSHDIELLIEKVENKYKKENFDKKIYGDIPLMGDAIFLLDNIPHLKGIYSVSKYNNQPNIVDYVSKKDIEEYKKLLKE